MIETKYFCDWCKREILAYVHGGMQGSKCDGYSIKDKYVGHGTDEKRQGMELGDLPTATKHICRKCKEEISAAKA